MYLTHEPSLGKHTHMCSKAQARVMRMNLAVVATALIPLSPAVCCLFLPCAYFSVKRYVPSCACCCCACVQTAGVTHAEVSTPCSVPINPRLIRSQSPREAKRSSAKMDVSTCARIKGLSLKVLPKRLGGYGFRIFPTPTQTFFKLDIT